MLSTTSFTVRYVSVAFSKCGTGRKRLGLRHQPVRLSAQAAAGAREVELPALESRGLLPILQVHHVRGTSRFLRQFQRVQVQSHRQTPRVTGSCFGIVRIPLLCWMLGCVESC